MHFRDVPANLIVKIPTRGEGLLEKTGYLKEREEERKRKLCCVNILLEAVLEFLQSAGERDKAVLVI